MKIGIDARFYGPIGKGLGRYTSELIRSLEVVDTENEYRIFLRKENFSHYTPKNPKFRKVLADFQWYSFEEQVKFPRILLREHCDLVHFPHFNVPILYYRPFVVTIHDLILLRFPTIRSTTLSPILYRFKFFAYRFVIRNAVFRSKRVVTVSEYTKRDILEQYSIPENKIAVTYEATYPFCLWERDEDVKSFFLRLGLLSSGDTTNFRDTIRPYVLYVGNAYPHKNLESLALAFSSSLDDPEARLVLVGREDYFYRRLKNRMRQHGGDRIIFSGMVSDRHLDTLYRFARVYVSPSLYEGFGLPSLEAMAKGVPVIAASTAAIPEVLGEAAYFYDPNRNNALSDALSHMWKSESIRKTLQEKGYRRSSEFSWGTMGEKTVYLYKEAMRVSNTKIK